MELLVQRGNYILIPEPSFSASGLCIVAACFLVIIAFLIASATFQDSYRNFSNRVQLEALSKRIGTSPSGEILLFLGFFVSIGYLISFSLVFHDKHRATNGLLPGLRSDLASIEDANLRDDPDSLQRRSEPSVIYFKPGSAKLEVASVEDDENIVRPRLDRSLHAGSVPDYSE